MSEAYKVFNEFRILYFTDKEDAVNYINHPKVKAEGFHIEKINIIPKGLVLEKTQVFNGMRRIPNEEEDKACMPRMQKKVS